MAKRTAIALLLALVCIGSVYAAGMDLQFRHWGTADGLSSNSVTCFLRSRQGHLWIATDHGLNRYDGQSFKTYTSSESTLSETKALYEDATGDLWIACRANCVRYDHKADAIDSNTRQHLHRMGIATDGDYQVFADCCGDLWVLDSRRISHYCFSTRKLAQKALPDAVRLDPSQMCIAETDGHLVILPGQQASFISIDKATMQLSETKPTSAIAETMRTLPCKLYADEHGGLWLYTLYGEDIHHLARGAKDWQQIDLQSFHPDIANSIRCLASDRNGLLWIATDKCGLFTYDFATAGVENITADREQTASLLSDNVSTVYPDAEGNIWVGYYKKGMSVTNDAVSRSFKTRYSLCGDATALMTDTDGNTWIGTDGNGLWHDDGHNLRQLLPGNTVTAIRTDRQGRIWVGTFHNGIYCIDGEDITNYNKSNSPLPDNAVMALQPDSAGTVWIGMLHDNLARLTHDKHGQARIEPNCHDVCALSFAYDGADDIYFSTYYGLGRITVSTGELRIITGNQSGTQQFEKMALSTLCLESQAHRLWVALAPKLALLDLDTDSLYHISTADGLCDDMVNGIIPLCPDNILAATSKGLSRITVSHDAQGALHFDISSYTQFTSNMHFNVGATARLAGGHLLLGTPDGCVEVDGEMLLAYNTPPNIDTPPAQPQHSLPWAYIIGAAVFATALIALLYIKRRKKPANDAQPAIQHPETTSGAKPDITPSDISITSLDEQLLSRAILTVEQHISDSDFNVEELARALGLGRTQLYKKITSLTGKGPADFIRTIRVKRGRQLLEESGMQIAEIAYAVGFSTPKRFSLNFKEEYGVMPSEYLKNHRNSQ